MEIINHKGEFITPVKKRKAEFANLSNDFPLHSTSMHYMPWNNNGKIRYNT